MLFANWVLTALIFLPLIEGSIRADPTDLSQSNSHVTVTWQLTEKGMPKGTLTQIDSKESVPLTGELFTVALSDGDTLRSSEMKIVRAAQLQPLTGNATAPRRSEQSPGSELVLELEAQDKSLHATWRSILRDGSNYLREEVTPGSDGSPGALERHRSPRPAHGRRQVRPEPSKAPPVATKTIFFAAEHPLSINTSDKGQVRCFLPHGAALTPGKKLDASAIIGFARDGQMRRDFLAYLERERAHPLPFVSHLQHVVRSRLLQPIHRSRLLDRIHSFGEELVEKRQIKLDSCSSTTAGTIPRRFGSRTAISPMDSELTPKAPRSTEPTSASGSHRGAGTVARRRNASATARRKDSKLPTDPSRWPVQNTMSDSIRFAWTWLKITASTNSSSTALGSDSGDDEASVTGGGDAIRDFEAMLDLIADLRALKPDIFINQTTGTWPSPFWLFDADSIWRGGDDHAFAGVGTPRQRWITYRDGDVYQRIVSRSKLYPLNSLMLHGIIYAQKAHDLNLDPQGDFTAEVRSFFGTGTQRCRNFTSRPRS